MRLKVGEMDSYKETLTSVLNMFEWEVLFLITDCEKIIWKAAVESFNLPLFNLEELLNPDEAPALCIKTAQTVTAEIPRSRYGISLRMQAVPIFDEERVMGSLVKIIPLLHPVAQAFEYISPVITAFFPEGVSLLMTDLEKYTQKINSTKFTFDSLAVGTHFKEGDPALAAIKSGQISIMDFPKDIYGFPVRIVASPMKEINTGAIIGNFVMCMPRTLVHDLGEMTDKLRDDVNEITYAIECLFVSASKMKEKEIILNKKIEEVYQLSERIYEVIGFLKQIADETKMAGLNSAVEALFDKPSGFGLIAREIKKLSDESKETIQDVTEIIELIKSTIDETKINSQLTMHASHEQAKATKDINYKIMGIGKIAERLAVIAKEI